MDQFTYELPDSKKIFNALIKTLNIYHHENISELLKNGRLSLSTSCDFSLSRDKTGRWNAYAGDVNFYVEMKNFEKINNNSNKEILLKLINDLVPKEAGYDFYSVNFSIKFDDDEFVEDLVSQVVGDLSEIGRINHSEYLSQDLIERGREMSEVYALLYVIENSLRNFIIHIFESEYGPEYMQHIKITRKITENVKNRKEDEKQKKWLSFRGDSDIHYMDFIDLKSLVSENYSLFEKYFDNLESYKSKMDEMYACRNKIGHNSYLDLNERNLLRDYYTWMIKCISE